MATVTLADDLTPLHHPKTWIGKYVWSQDHKVIAIQYALTAIAIGPKTTCNTSPCTA